MGDEWRRHLQSEEDGTIRIKAHGNMKVDARIVTDENHFNNHIDDRGPEQLVNAAEIPGIVGEAWAMADWHFGYGLPIGGVIATDINHGENGGAISPGAVGFDINCGVRVLALEATVDDIPNIKKLGGRMAGRIPAGASGKGGLDIDMPQIRALTEGGAQAAVEMGIGFDEDLPSLESNGLLEVEDATLSNRALERGLRALGTLGSGNHFLELQSVEKLVDEETAKHWGLYEGQLLAMIHSGSRGLGHQVCSEHSRKLEQKYKRTTDGWYAEEYDFTLTDRQLACAPIHSKEGQSYLQEMNAAANFAFANRSALAHRLREVLRLEMGVDGEARTLYDVAHNIAKIETHVVHGKNCQCAIHRKGATRAFAGDSGHVQNNFQGTGQPVLVPGDMGTGSWIMAGPKTGQNQAFGSSCHGAGRALSRTKAKQMIDGKALKQRLENSGIRIHASTPNVLSEEAPDAYKDVDEVIELTNRAGLARPVVRMTPNIVIKG
ncbi:MAG: RtcB family protein [Candidatus Thermoplasmatota archaeon]|nr:RtcB family protein [Candidatus Thermoplasmatota archaeon]